VEESLIETLICLLAEPTMELLSSSSVMRVPLSLRLLDVYYPLQIFLNESCTQEFGVLVCGLVFSEADLSCFAAFIPRKLPPTTTDLLWKSVPPPPPWLGHDASMVTP